jgi:hypothetical protein
MIVSQVRHELEQIEKDLGKGALTNPEFTVTVRYRSSTKTFAHHYDETAIVRHRPVQCPWSGSLLSEIYGIR